MNNRRDDTAKARRMTGQGNIEILSTDEQHDAYRAGLSYLNDEAPQESGDVMMGALNLQEGVSDVGSVGAMEIMGRVGLLVLEKWVEWTKED